MGFMAQEENAPGSSLMVLGNELSKNVGQRVAIMGIIESYDDQQVGKVNIWLVHCWIFFRIELN